MTKKFTINEVSDGDTNPFDRQQRISWWNQDKLKMAKVMVVGAGAIGNETLKNLALMGIGNIYIADFDDISTSNLSRTVLFRKGDKGKRKAEVAALRTKELSLLDDVAIHWFDGDVVWELGTGIFGSMDIVLGCLDNVETRFAVNRQCWLTKTPWIDAGIYELGGHVTPFIPPEAPCYQCAASREQLISARKRYSCDDFKRTVFEEGKMPTVQITSSIVSAIQVQEAIKYLCDQPIQSGKKIYLQGKTNDFDLFTLMKNDNCTGHVTYPEIISLPLTNAISLENFLKFISQEEYSGMGATLDLRGDRTFVVSVACKSCGTTISLNKPSFKIFDTETICQDCKSGMAKNVPTHLEQRAVREDKVDFNLVDTPSQLLNMSLSALGIPFRHVVSVRDSQESYKYYELSNDQPFTTV